MAGEAQSQGSWTRAVVVIPCYNEVARLEPAKVMALLAESRVSVLLVDDGSTDGTAALLTQIAASAPDRIEALVLPRNQGKAEAVRAGLLHALGPSVREAGAGHLLVGYIDADFATPPDEVLRLLTRFANPALSVVMGARIARLGARIERRATRHYIGRVFASGASLVLGLAVYDTQCGAKFFRDGPAIRHALSQPFLSRWIFDVELLGRLTNPLDGPAISPDAIEEVPLLAWRDVAGSKLGLAGMARAGSELIRLGWQRFRR